MAKPFHDFTFGGQLFEAYWNMFLSSARPILWVACGTATVFLVLTAITTLQHRDLYYLIMHGMSSGWTAMGFNPDKAFRLYTPYGTFALRVADIPSIDWVRYAVERWVNIVVRSGQGFMLGTGVGIAIYPWIAQHFARKQRERTNQRGAFITTPKELLAEIKSDNAAAAKAEQEAARKEGGGKTEAWEPYRIAGFPFPWRHETTHFFAMGTTGSGKSTVLKDLLSQARARGDRAVIFDLTGTFVECFYDPGRDVILNALDTRCPAWSIFNECSDRVELHTAARALIPSTSHQNDPFWIEAARLLFVEACLKMIAVGQKSNADLGRELMTADLRNLHARLRGTLAGPLSEPEARRMAESIRATLNANAAAIKLLPDEGTPFSIRKWVTEDDQQGRMLFLSCQSTHLDVLRPLLTLWYDTAIQSLMSLPAAPNRLRMWFLFDELGALNRLPSLEDGMRTARNFGGAFALGIHTIQQLWSVYGQNEGDTIASLGRTQLYLAQPDYRSADWCSAMIGKTEYRESERSTTVGVERLRDGVGWTQRTEYRALALPDEIMNLPNLEGYIKFPGGYPAARIQIPYQVYPTVAPGFLRRPTPEHGEEDPEGADSVSDAVDGDEDRPPEAAKGTKEEQSARRNKKPPEHSEAEQADADTPASKVKGMAARWRTRGSSDNKGGGGNQRSRGRKKADPAKAGTGKAGTPDGSQTERPTSKKGTKGDRSRQKREPAAERPQDMVVGPPQIEREPEMGD